MKRLVIYIFLCTVCFTYTSCKTQKNTPKSKVQKKKGWEQDDVPKDYLLDHTNKVIKESDRREKKRLKEQAQKTQEGLQQEKDSAKAAEKGKKRSRKVNTGKFSFY